MCPLHTKNTGLLHLTTRGTEPVEPLSVICICSSDASLVSVVPALVTADVHLSKALGFIITQCIRIAGL